MIPRVLTTSKGKLIVVFIVVVLLSCVVYMYLNQIQANYKSAQWFGERCYSELSSIKYQLNVVTEYKNKIDKLLKETQMAYETDKERFKDTMESCVAMKQQSSICQSQFEDLQAECKKVRQEYNKVLSDSGKINIV